MIDKLSLQLSVFGPLQGASGTRIANWTHSLLHFHAATILVLVAFNGFTLLSRQTSKSHLWLIVKSQIRRSAATWQAALAEFDVPVLPVALHQRVLYAESAAQGLAVFEVARTAMPRARSWH
jgi:hypothetical protein